MKVSTCWLRNDAPHFALQEIEDQTLTEGDCGNEAFLEKDLLGTDVSGNVFDWT